MELKQYFELLRRWLWLLALGLALGAGSAYVASSLQQPVYQATATLLISEAPQGSVSGDYQALLTSERLARTYLQLITTRPVIDQVRADLLLALSAEDLVDQIRVELVRDTQLIRLHVEDVDPLRAAAIANTLPLVFSQYNEAQQASRFAESKAALTDEIRSVDAQIAALQADIAARVAPADAEAQAHLDRLQAELAELRQTRTSLIQSYESLRLAEAQSINNVVVAEAALQPTAPIRPRTLQNTALAGVVGLMLAVGIAFLVEYLDDTLKTPAQVNSLLGLPVIGVLARLTSKQMVGEPIAQAEPRSPAAEAFRGLRTNLQFASVDQPLRRILVTSIGPSEGKSTVVANLAVVTAQSGHRVAIIDADLRRPTQHRLFGRPNRLGLSDTLLQRTLHLNGSLQPAAVPNLMLLSTGALPPNPAELLGSQKMGSLIQLMDSQVDRVIIDSPPVSAVTDAVILANQADGVVLVVEAGKTKIGAAQQVKEQLDRVGAKLVGVVLNKVPIGRDGYYYSYYYSYYNSYYGEEGARRPRGLLGRLLPRRRRKHSAAAFAETALAPAEENHPTP